jgi:hypothetical protein
MKLMKTSFTKIAVVAGTRKLDRSAKGFNYQEATLQIEERPT